MKIQICKTLFCFHLLFSVSQDSILDLILNNLFLIVYSRRNRESRNELRIETRNGLTTFF